MSRTIALITRDTSRKVAAAISQNCRRAKRNQQETPLEPKIGLGFTEISYRQTEKRNRLPALNSMQVI